jgi:WD repeat-containing protein 68
MDSEDTGDVAQDKVHTYQSEQNVYAIGFSTRADKEYRLAVCTFSEEGRNLFEVVQLNLEINVFERRAGFYHEFPANKVIWYPCEDTAAPDIMATSGEHINIWEVGAGGCAHRAALVSKSKFRAPLTSFDWSLATPNLMVASSIDASCTVWDFVAQKMISQMIVGTDEVYDISFSAERNIFAQVSGDGALRQFDIRNSQNADLLYQTGDRNPIVKLAWNRKDKNYIGLVEMDKKHITLVDCRRMGVVSKLEHHQDSVNAICWAPHTSTHICSVGDDKQALIWDLSNSQEVNKSPLLEYTSEDPISNLCWSLLQNDWLSISYSDFVQILKV